MKKPDEPTLLDVAWFAATVAEEAMLVMESTGGRWMGSGPSNATTSVLNFLLCPDTGIKSGALLEAISKGQYDGLYWKTEGHTISLIIPDIGTASATMPMTAGGYIEPSSFVWTPVETPT